MRIFVFIVLLSLLIPSVWAQSSGWVQATELKAELVSDYQQVKPGQQLTLALHFIPTEHWHTYWLNPGDSGLATRIEWTLPAGVTAGPIQWPVPQAIRVPPLVNYGFEGPTLLLTQLQLSPDFQGDLLPVSAKVDWLVCAEICIPSEAVLQLTLPVRNTAELSKNYSALFEQARQQQPKSLPQQGRFEVQNGTFSAVLPLPEDLKVSAFFVGGTELVDHSAAQSIDWVDGQLLLRQPQNTYFSAAPAEIPLVLQTAAGAVSTTLQFNQHLSVPVSKPQTEWLQWLWMLVLAGAGGLVLNLMPCVFPVLSFKALSLAQQQAGQQSARSEALWYSAGVVLSFVALAGVMLSLRSAGEVIGWGFQLQQAWVVLGLAYLLLVLGLSLSGLMQLGAGLMNTGQALTAREGKQGAFFTGILAVVVASPCTAPFMGAALGYAASQPAWSALSIFAALGLGMALPFLLLGFWPALGRKLPQPGPWMALLKQWLAYPLYLSAVWLLWVYGRQQGLDAMALALVGVVALVAACWIWGLVQLGRQPKVWLVAVAALAALALLLPQQVQQAQGDASADHSLPWTESRMQQLISEGKPVLVNMTADWCITCLVNERVALNTDSSKAAMKLYDLHYLKGDWTRKDPAITAYLRQFQRDGVPLYVVYWPGQPPEILPQILTPDSVRQALEQLSRKNSTQGE
ncbi:protein-disulfide reductase DsbD domain-containing protein [Rheinheimera sp.]|uniref:protein-disulfide reductase DsbD family protein n=1 Tax=Rheinheimera sp. TaxID=1869214 RepID=UPI00307D724E